jgi:hypothetical protein
MASFDAQMRLLVLRKVSEDDKLVEYDALLLDRFLDILQDVNGPEIKETISVLTFTDQIRSGNILVRCENEHWNGIRCFRNFVLQLALLVLILTCNS